MMCGPQEIAIVPHRSTLNSGTNIVSANLSNAGDCDTSTFNIINDRDRKINDVLKSAMAKYGGSRRSAEDVQCTCR